MSVRTVEIECPEKQTVKIMAVSKDEGETTEKIQVLKPHNSFCRRFCEGGCAFVNGVSPEEMEYLVFLFFGSKNVNS